MAVAQAWLLRQSPAAIIVVSKAPTTADFLGWRFTKPATPDATPPTASRADLRHVFLGGETFLGGEAFFDDAFFDDAFFDGGLEDLRPLGLGIQVLLLSVPRKMNRAKAISLTPPNTLTAI